MKSILLSLAPLLLFLAPLLLGLGASRLVVWALDRLAGHLRGNDLVQGVASTLNWIGGGGIFYVPLAMADFSEAMDMGGADAIVTLSYAAGLGVGFVRFIRRGPPTFIQELQRILGTDEIEVLLLTLRYSLDTPEGATALGMSLEDFEEVYRGALEKISRRGDSFLGALRSRARKLR